MQLEKSHIELCNRIFVQKTDLKYFINCKYLNMESWSKTDYGRPDEWPLQKISEIYVTSTNKNKRNVVDWVHRSNSKILCNITCHNNEFIILSERDGDTERKKKIIF